MRVLLLLLLVAGCEVDRDLRPERFACDSGGSCTAARTDGGAERRVISCPIGQTCRCNEAESCEFICNGRCTLECKPGSDCITNCSASECNTTCETGAVCEINCSAGTCDTSCETGASCAINCGFATCTCDGPECPF